MATDDTTQTPLRLSAYWPQIVKGFGAGDLAVVMARAGVGKTTFLVQVALDHLLRGQKVLHVSAAQTVEHLHARYDAIFDDWADLSDLANREELRADVARRRMISAFSDHRVCLGRIEETADTYRRHLSFTPDLIVFDGYAWEKHSSVETAAILGGARSYGKLNGASVWVTAQTHREVTGPHPIQIPEPCAPVVQLISRGIFLEPHSNGVHMRVLKGADLPDEGVVLDADTLRPLRIDREPNGGVSAKLPSTAFTLMSGGAGGAEAEFGACAEQWGIKEQNFTFEGRAMARQEGVVMLNAVDLRQGAVSEVYLRAKMNRTYPDSPIFRKTLQSIWHQVKTAGEVFVVGVVLEDGTVKGGTGWAAELARHWNKPVHVFDQERRSWVRWVAESSSWEAEEPPRIRSRRFCGTGTRYLSDDGKAAIHALFARTFTK